MFCRKMWWTPYLCLLGADLYGGRLARVASFPTSGRTGSFGAAGLTGRWRSQSTTVSTTLPRQHLGRPGLFLTSHSSDMYPMRDYKRPYLKVVVGGGHHHTFGCWHDARKYLTLKSMAFSLHARSSWSLRRLRPAVPPIAMFRARVETVAVIRSAGTRTS